MEQLIVTLKQHSPLIHFQHDQDEATLRASEVKAKLDKFIIKINTESGIPENWKAKWKSGNNGIKSLAYKISIKSNDIPKKDSVTIIPPNKDTWILHLAPINLIIFSFEGTLLTEIRKQISHFFLSTSFGKRQNKGFGCFYPISVEEKGRSEIITEFQGWSQLEVFLKKGNFPIYLFDKTIQPGNSNFYEVVSEKWRILKSGFNYGGIYEKSAVFKYLCSQILRWDKRWIKKEIKKLIDGKILPYDLQSKSKKGKANEPNDCSQQSWIDDVKLKYEYRFGRAMLGLAENYEFLTESNNHKYKIIVESKEVERFKAPVFFKVFNNNLFAILGEVPNEIFDKPLGFRVQTKKKEYNSKSKKDEWIPDSNIPEFELVDSAHQRLILKTPTEKEFNYESFLDSHFKTVGFDRIKKQ